MAWHAAGSRYVVGCYLTKRKRRDDTLTHRRLNGVANSENACTQNEKEPLKAKEDG
jgi:hypothetical protein